MKLLTVLKILLFAACTTLTVASGYAAPITVINSSFEDPGVGAIDFWCGDPRCAYDRVAPLGWTGTGIVGSFQPGSGSDYDHYLNYVPDGVTVAYSNSGTLSQVVDATVEEGVIYTLQVDWGKRQDDGEFDPLTQIILDVGGNAVLATGIEPTFGNWSTYTATYVGTADDSGKSLGIELSSNDQGDWDNVRLDASIEDGSPAVPEPVSTVPEPASYLLLGMGLAGLAGLRRFNFRHDTMR